MSFSGQSFSQRLGAMGDAAESVFEATYPQKFVRYGLNRPPLHMSTIPPFIRHTPDYLTSKGLVEVQGFGSDQIAKFKYHKTAALVTWNEKFRVDFFLWDSKNKRYGWLRWLEFVASLNDGRVAMKAFENDGNEYWAVPAAALQVERWVPLDA